MQPQKNSALGTIIKILSGVIVLGLAGFAFSQMGDKAPVVEAPATGEKTPTSTKPVSNTNDRKYKDGTYSAVGNYSSPAGREEVDITLTIKNDVVVSATFVVTASNPGSIKNQELFKQGFDQYVVGKSIDSLKLQVVNGSSLTPKGFMDALQKIKTEALA
jgi:uncharacterized protein with FMN-binding domain